MRKERIIEKTKSGGSTSLVKYFVNKQKNEKEIISYTITPYNVTDTMQG